MEKCIDEVAKEAWDSATALNCGWDNGEFEGATEESILDVEQAICHLKDVLAKMEASSHKRPDINDIIQYYPELTGVHPACTAVPAISDDEYDALRESIRDHGLATDLAVTPDGLLLDGRGRLVACFEERKDVRFRTIKTSPWDYSYDLNIARRHLSTFEKAEFGEAWKETKDFT